MIQGPRASWDETWFSMAEVMARRSRCVRSGVGAIIVTADNRVASTGYNGPASSITREIVIPSRLKYVPPERRVEKLDGPCSNWCPRAQSDAEPQTTYGLACPSIHAESNALLRADWTAIQGGRLYVTSSVCADCAKLVSNSGIRTVVHRVSPEHAYRRPEEVESYLRSCDVTVVRWP